MYATNYLENGFLNTLRGITFSAPATIFLALFLSDPGESGAEGIEVAYPGYARQVLSFSAPGSMNGGIGVQNINELTFPNPTGAAGTVTHIAVCDSLGGGNILCRGELTDELSIGMGQPPVFSPGDVQFYLSGSLSTVWKARLLNILRGTSISGVTPYYSLWNGSPESAGSELSGDNYSRVPMTFGAPAEQGSGQMLISNSVAGAFNRPTAPWGVWDTSAIMTAASGGEPISIRARGESIEIRKNYTPTFAVGAIRLGLN